MSIRLSWVIVMNSIKRRAVLLNGVIRKTFFKHTVVALIELTDLCALKCEHCYHYESIRKAENIPLSEWKRRFRAHRRNGYVYAIFLGGEPAERIDALELAQDYFPYFSTFTAGYKLIPPSIRQRIHLSLDGTATMHERVRGKASFDAAVKNYTGDKRVILNCMLSKLNYLSQAELRAFLDLGREMGVSGIAVDFFIPRHGSVGDADLLLDEEQYREIQDVLLSELGRKDSLLISTPSLVRAQVSGRFPFDTCAMSESSLTFSTNNENRTKLCGFGMCEHCRSMRRYNVPWYRVNEFYAWKKQAFKWMFFKT